MEPADINVNPPAGDQVGERVIETWAPGEFIPRLADTSLKSCLGPKSLYVAHRWSVTTSLITGPAIHSIFISAGSLGFQY